ncbi:fungal-specific transcription factor domain-containing protein [Dichotomocladium elegans]|nr:fungal-specific transcription factor domain-containing protein [Dichotomocladium elegans]
MGEVSTWQDYGDLVRWSPEPGLPSHYLSSIDMPVRSVQENLIHVFFTQCHPSILPSFSRRMFYDQLNTKGPLVTPLLLNTLYAHAAKHIPTAAHGSLFYNRARRLVDDFLDEPRVSTVIALLYMVSYDHDDAAWSSSRAWMYCGMAVRMCLDLGLHTSNYSSQMSQFDIELRKRTLWTCYIMDKWTSCMAERPWMMRAQDISLDLPSPLPEDDPEECAVLEGFVYLCRLMILMERVIEFFGYGPKKKHIWNMEHESETIRLLNQVEDWRGNLPDTLQPPSSNIIRLLGYTLELSLVMCCRYQDEQLQLERRRSLASNITHLISIVLQEQQPQAILTFSLTAFTAVFAALTHASDPAIGIAQDVQIQFHTSLQHVRRLLMSKRSLGRLIDMTLNPGYTNGDTSTSSSVFKETAPATSPSSSSYDPSATAAAAKEAAAAAIGAVGAPAFGPHKTVEPADYTFELISVADEWARSLIYPS